MKMHRGDSVLNPFPVCYGLLCRYMDRGLVPFFHNGWLLIRVKREETGNSILLWVDPTAYMDERGKDVFQRRGMILEFREKFR